MVELTEVVKHDAMGNNFSYHLQIQILSVLLHRQYFSGK